MRILVVEDDVQLARQIASALTESAVVNKIGDPPLIHTVRCVGYTIHE